uniref:Uncharacterized protein n=1 Tax=Streptomyces sp. NBC_00003 TaxID=2903608 RepID=A0AAU2UZ44_9ACTN
MPPPAGFPRRQVLVEPGLGWEVDRIELAAAQFAGWVMLNRSQLLSPRGQLGQAKKSAEAQVRQASQARLAGRAELVWAGPRMTPTRRALLSAAGERSQPLVSAAGLVAGALTAAPYATATPSGRAIPFGSH